MNRSFCGKCRQRKEGGTGYGRRYRCPKCHAERLAALLCGTARSIHAPARVSTPEAA